jgi:hypothetical protein
MDQVGAEHAQRANTYDTFDRTATRDLTLFVIAPEERDVPVETAVPPLVSAAIALASIFTVYVGASLAWVLRGKLRDPRTQEQASPTP